MSEHTKVWIIHANDQIFLLTGDMAHGRMRRHGAREDTALGAGEDAALGAGDGGGMAQLENAARGAAGRM